MLLWWLTSPKWPFHILARLPAAEFYNVMKGSVEKGLGTIVVERAVDLLCLILVIILMFLVQFSLIYSFIEKVVTPISDKFSSGLNMLLILGGCAIALGLVTYFLIRRFKHTEAYVRLRIMIMNVRDGIYAVRHLKNFPLFIFIRCLSGCVILRWFGCVFMPWSKRCTSA